MDRRSSLKSSLAAVAATLVPFRSDTDPVTTDFLAGKALAHRVAGPVHATYVATRSLLFFQERAALGCLVDTCVLQICYRRDWGVGPLRADVRGSFRRVIGPAPLLRAAVANLSDVCKARENTLFLGLEHQDRRVWLRIPAVVLTAVGPSVSVRGRPSDDTPPLLAFFAFPEDDGDVMVSESLEFMGAGAPELCADPRTAPAEAEPEVVGYTAAALDLDR
jgi:hypothetical protein